MIPPFSDPFETVQKNADWQLISKGGAGKPQSMKEVRTGQALNVVATAGGLNAMRMAVPEAKHAYGTYKASKLATKTGNPVYNNPVQGPTKSGWKAARRKEKLLKPLPQGARKALSAVNAASKSKKGLAILGAGAIGLHSSELAGDAIAARSLHNSAKTLKYNQKKRA